MDTWRRISELSETYRDMATAVSLGWNHASHHALRERTKLQQLLKHIVFDRYNLRCVSSSWILAPEAISRICYSSDPELTSYVNTTLETTTGWTADGSLFRHNGVIQYRAEVLGGRVVIDFESPWRQHLSSQGSGLELLVTEKARASEMIHSGWSFLAARDRELQLFVGHLLRVIITRKGVPEQDGSSLSWSRYPGRCVLWWPYQTPAVICAENLLHEAMHTWAYFTELVRLGPQGVLQLDPVNCDQKIESTWTGNSISPYSLLHTILVSGTLRLFWSRGTDYNQEARLLRDKRLSFLERGFAGLFARRNVPRYSILCDIAACFAQN